MRVELIKPLLLTHDPLYDRERIARLWMEYFEHELDLSVRRRRSGTEILCEMLSIPAVFFTGDTNYSSARWEHRRWQNDH